MSIVGVFGLPGAGKSTFLAYVADCALQGKAVKLGVPGFRTELFVKQKWENVFCNFPIKGTKILRIGDIGKYDFSNSLLLIDEIMHYFDSRNWKDFSDESKYFWSMTRHYNTSVCWCSQSYRDCDLKIRNLTDTFCLLENHGTRSKVIPLRQYMKLEHGQISEGYQTAPPVGQLRLRRSRYYHMFDSYARKEYPKQESELWPFSD